MRKKNKINDFKWGIEVYSKKDFSEVPAGTEGVITKISLGNEFQAPYVIVKWNSPNIYNLVDQFNEDEFDYLEII